MDRAQYCRLRRYKAVVYVIEMGHHAVSRRHVVPCQRPQSRYIGVALRRLPVAPLILPCVQGADRLTVSVQIDDAVLLTRHADALCLGKAGQQAFYRLPGQKQDPPGILFPLPVLTRQGRIVGQRFRRQYAAFLHRHGADGGGADIQSQCYHGPFPQQKVEPGSSRVMISCWMVGDRSRKFTNVPWMRMIYTPVGAYFFGSASTLRRVSAVVTLT